MLKCGNGKYTTRNFAKTTKKMFVLKLKSLNYNFFFLSKARANDINWDCVQTALDARNSLQSIGKPMTTSTQIRFMYSHSARCMCARCTRWLSLSSVDFTFSLALSSYSPSLGRKFRINEIFKHFTCILIIIIYNRCYLTISYQVASRIH